MSEPSKAGPQAAPGARAAAGGASRPMQCPSAQPDWPQAQVFGVVMGTAAAPRVAYLERPQPMSAQWAALTAPLAPAEVLRIAAPCAQERCQHFDTGRCSLAERTVAHVEPVADRMPPCAIRPACRWWNEQGPAACRRCPGIATSSFPDDERLILAGTPVPRSGDGAPQDHAG